MCTDRDMPDSQAITIQCPFSSGSPVKMLRYTVDSQIEFALDDCTLPNTEVPSTTGTYPTCKMLVNPRVRALSMDHVGTTMAG